MSLLDKAPVGPVMQHIENPTFLDYLMESDCEGFLANSIREDGTPAGIYMLLGSFDGGNTNWAWCCRAQKLCLVHLYQTAEGKVEADVTPSTS